MAASDDTLRRFSTRKRLTRTINEGAGICEQKREGQRDDRPVVFPKCVAESGTFSELKQQGIMYSHAQNNQTRCEEERQISK
jgi:hypothetical protein